MQSLAQSPYPNNHVRQRTITVSQVNLRVTPGSLTYREKRTPLTPRRDAPRRDEMRTLCVLLFPRVLVAGERGVLCAVSDGWTAGVEIPPPGASG